MMRPWTLEPPLSNTVFYGWTLYASVDVRYSDTKDIVTMATGRVMVLEIILNFVAVYLSYKGSRHANLLAFTTSVMTFWKTAWYLVMYIRPPEGTPSYFHDDKSYLEIFLIFWFMNSIWVVLPFLVMCHLWNRLAQLPPAKVTHGDEYEVCNSDVI